MQFETIKCKKSFDSLGYYLLQEIVKYKFQIAIIWKTVALLPPPTQPLFTDYHCGLYNNQNASSKECLKKFDLLTFSELYGFERRQ